MAGETARCPRCHRQAPVSLGIFQNHMAGSQECGGSRQPVEPVAAPAVRVAFNHDTSGGLAHIQVWYDRPPRVAGAPLYTCLAAVVHPEFLGSGQYEPLEHTVGRALKAASEWFRTEFKGPRKW